MTAEKPSFVWGNKLNWDVVLRSLSELIIVERIVDMHNFLKKSLVVLIIALFLAACGPLVTTPATEPTVVSEPTQDVLTLALPVDGASDSASRFIGLQYPPFPASLSQDFSMLIQDSDGGKKTLWLSKTIGYDANGTPKWDVKDVLALSDLEPGLTRLPDGCLLNGMPDSEISVAGRNEVLVLAWRANTTLGKFESIAVDGIRCSSDKALDL